MTRVAAVPQVIVEIDGAPIPPQQAMALGEIRVRQRLSMPALCELVFLDDVSASDVRLVSGSSVRLIVGEDSSPLFAGEITAIEYVHGAAHEREVRVRAYDLLHRLGKRQPVRVHVQVTLADLARELVAGLGLTVDAQETGPVWDRLFQCGQSDLELFSEMAQRCGIQFVLRDNALQLLSLRGTSDEMTLELGRELLEAVVEVNGNVACRSVAAAGWDPRRVVTHKARATTPRLGRDAASQAPPDRLGSHGERTLVDRLVQNSEQAEAMAQAELDLRATQEVILTGVADGHSRLRPGVRVNIRGIAPQLAGRYVLTRVDHLIDSQRGFVSEICSEPPVPAALVRGSVATIGAVTSVDDPERLGRVQVAFPTFENSESEWMEVLTAGAGAGKGLVALPDIGDYVLVLFANGDPAQGVVLGGLYGAQGPPDAGVEERAVRRYTFLTPGGQRVRLDDAQRSIRLENSDGSSLEPPQKVVLHANVDMEIEAPGRTLTIRADTINFERG